MRGRKAGTRSRGVTSLQMLAILVPVVFAFMGFAFDLGRLYLAKGELQTAANAAAMAAAGRLIGTDAAAEAASRQMRLTLEGPEFANRYGFGAYEIGQTSGDLASEIFDPEYYTVLSEALAADSTGGSNALARYVKVRLRGEAPLLFFGFLPIAQERKVPIEVDAVAGQSAPLCQACGIEPIAIAAPDTAGDDFGLVVGTRYTLGYQCTGPQQPGLLGDSTLRLAYLLLNRYNEGATLFADEQSQAFRQGANGITAGTNASQACVTVTTATYVDVEANRIWATAQPQACNAGRSTATVQSFACGLAARFDPATLASNAACSAIAEIDGIAALATPDVDVADQADYAAYPGNGRRIITVAVVTALSTTDPMEVLGFRQFLLQPATNDVTTNPGDSNSRLLATYIGWPMPVRQGRFDGCTLSAGPGKVVLHR